MTDSDKINIISHLMERIRKGAIINCTGKVFVSPGNFKSVTGKLTHINVCVSECGICPKYGIDTGEIPTQWAVEVEEI